MKKRLIAILTAATMLITTMIVPTIAIAEDDAFALYEEDAKLLAALGLYETEIDEDLGFDATESVAVSDFIEAVVKMKIGAFDDGTDYLAVAKQYNMFNVETEYKIDDDISFNDAVKVIIDALGYDLIAEAKGGYPYGYMETARNIDLFDDVEYQINQPIELGNVIKLLANAVDAPVAQHNTYGETKYTFVAQEGKTLLSTYRDIIKVAGLVKANTNTTLDDISGLMAGEVQIGANVYNAGATNAQAMLGKYVTAYVQQYEGRTKDTVLYISDDNYLNKELSVVSENIISVNEKCTQVVYEDQNWRERTINLSPTRRVIYNGIVYYDFTKNDFMDADANVRFVDNTGDNVYDVVFIDRYDTHMLVNYTSSMEGMIFNQYTNEASAEGYIQLDTDTPENYSITLKDGTPITIKDIQKNDVASVYRSKNPQKPFVNVIISRDTIEGTYTACNTDSGEYVIVTENGEEAHKYNSIYFDEINDAKTKIKAPVLGENYVYYLDALGHIMGAVSDSVAGWEYAVLYGAGSESPISDTVDAKYLNTQGDWIKTTLAKKVSYYDATGKNVYTPRELMEIELGLPKVVMLQTNADGQINGIKSAVVTTERNKDMLTVSVNTHKYDPSFHFAGELFYESDAVVFVLPTDEGIKGNTDDYMAVTTSYFKLNQTYTYSAYNLDEYNFTDCISIVDSGSEIKANYESAQLFIVTDVIDVLNSDEEPTKKITGAMGSYTSISLEAAKPEVFKNVNKGTDGTKEIIADIKKGDVLQYSTDTKGRINAIKFLYSLDNGVMSTNISTNTLIYNGVTAGEIKKIDGANGRMIIEVGGNERPAKFSSGASVLIYDVDTNTVTKGSATDIIATDYAVIRYGIYNPSEFVVIRK